MLELENAAFKRLLLPYGWLCHLLDPRALQGPKGEGIKQQLTLPR